MSRKSVIDQKIIRASNACYNVGLELAQVRDLSGAIPYLQRSLKWNKKNTQARNLLGLIYCEIGEMAEALEEWTISASYQPEGNPATSYLNVIAARQSRVDNINQVIRKYNQAIFYANNDSEDMAVLQARQVIVRNPKHLKAHLLLALLYMKKKEYGKAERILRKALHIDAGNTTALRYLLELREIADQKKLKVMKAKQEIPMAEPADENAVREDNVLIPVYKESTGSWNTVFLLLAGVVIGCVCTYFLLFPAERRELQSEANRVQQEYFSELTRLQNEIDRLKDHQDDWESEKQEMQDELNKYEGEDPVAAQYMILNDVFQHKIAGDDYGALLALQQISLEGELPETFLASYQELMNEYTAEGLDRILQTAVEQYELSQFEVSRDYLLKVLEIRPESPEALYWLGVSYWNLHDQDSATQYLMLLIEGHPDHGLAEEARWLLGISAR